jgi:hypothetical protein
MGLYLGYKLGSKSKPGGTRRSSGEENKGGKGKTDGKTNREDFIGKTIKED